MPMPTKPITRPSTAPPKPKTPAYAANALNATAGADETDLLPGDRARAVRVKPPPIQGNEATTTYTGPQGKDGRPIPPPEDHTPKLIKPPTNPTPPPGNTNPPAPAAPPPNNNVVIRQWNLNRGIPNQKMQWDPATQALMMDGRPVFQVGRNMSIDAQGNGVTDEATWRREMERYGYGEQANSNIPSNQRDMINAALTTQKPQEYWASALGQAELQNIQKNREQGLINARGMLAARGVGLDGSTGSRMLGQVYGTEQQALVDAAPKLMDAARRSYLDVLNSDIAARTGQNAQEIAESNVNGMFRGAPTYASQQDAFEGVMKVAEQRETMPGMDTSMLTHPGIKALGGQINDIAGQERAPWTQSRNALEVTREGNLLTHDRATADAKSKDWSEDQRKLYNAAHAWATDPEHPVPLTAASLEAAKRQFGAPPGMSGKQATEVLETLFGGGKAGSEPSRAELEDQVIRDFTQGILAEIGTYDLKKNPEMRDKLWPDIQKKIRATYAQNPNAFGSLTLVKAEELAKEILMIADSSHDDADMLRAKLEGNRAQQQQP